MCKFKPALFNVEALHVTQVSFQLVICHCSEEHRRGNINQSIFGRETKKVRRYLLLC